MPDSGGLSGWDSRFIFLTSVSGSGAQFENLRSGAALYFISLTVEASFDFISAYTVVYYHKIIHANNKNSVF